MNIIIVKFNLPELEEKCIESVKKYTDLERHTLTVYDNYPKKENLAVVWNRLIEESEDENICLLNSDTLVEKNWTRLEENIEAGAVGPITNNCGGNQKNLEKKDSVEEINDLSGFCYCFTKKVWEEVGKFPEDMPFYGQETVFNRKLEDHGYKLLVDRRVYVHHFKGRSWDKARKAGDISDLNREYGAMHYRNYVRRLADLRKVIPQGKKVLFLGAGKDNPFPTFIGIDQFVSDFGGLHLSIETPLEDMIAYDPDIVITVETKYNPEWYEKIAELKKQGAKTALYFMDLRRPNDPTFKFTHPPLERYFDKLFICAKEYLPEWEKEMKVKAEWLPQATIQQPIPPTGEKNNLIHIGDLELNCHDFRKGIYEALAREVETTQMNSQIRDDRIAISKQSYGLYGSARLSLAMPIKAYGYSSDRMYHIMGSGGCGLVLNNGGLDFKHGEHLLWFKDSEEAVKIAKEVTDEQITKIKKTAFDYVQSNHLYKDRYIELITKLCV